MLPLTFFLNYMYLQIIILAAGRGTRMRSEIPKVLGNLSGQPLIRRLLDNIQNLKSGFSAVIVVGYKHELVEEYLGPAYTYAFQEEQLGTANAVESAKDKIFADNAIVLYGDMPFITARSLEKLIAIHKDNNSKFSMFTAAVPHFEDQFNSHNGFGRIIRGPDRKIVSIRELVDASEVEKKILEVNPGVYMFDTTWLWQNIGLVKKNSHSEYYLTDLVDVAVKSGVEVFTAEIDPMEVFGINTPEHLEESKKLPK